MAYSFKEIEGKWQKIWQQQKTFAARIEKGKKKFYCLEMFPYPSGSGLHVGHLKNYVPMDAFCRFKSMQGFNVLHPMGWDAFGQPAENEAIRRGRNPRDMVPEYAATYMRTLVKTGCSYDWDREINSSLPDYYKWTQWIFLLLYHKGLAYRATAPINWCPDMQDRPGQRGSQRGPVLALRRAGREETDAAMVFPHYGIRRPPADDLDRLNWSEGMKEMQRDWIGRSEGADVEFRIDGSDLDVTVFTTRPDTLFGATFMVLAPEHPLVPQITDTHRRARSKRISKKPGRIGDRTHECGTHQNRRIYRRLCHQPGQRRKNPGLDCRLCADGLWHRRHHVRSRP